MGNILEKIVAVLLLIATMSAAVDQKALETVAKGNMAFTVNLYKILKEKEGNLFFSPISIEVILALTSMGAGGNTAQQMIKSLHLPQDQEVTKAGFRTIMDSLKSTDNMTLEIANKVFGEKTFPIKEDFKQVSEKAFLSAAEEMDFIKNAEGSRQVINKWVEERTREKIKNLIPQGVIDSMTRLVLVNAIYFKGLWKNKFDPERTRTEPFYVTPNEKRDVRMMHIKKKFLYGEKDELQAKVLAMPYEGEQMSLVILLPFEKDGLPKLEDKLSGLDLPALVGSLPLLEVEVSLPRFKLEETIDLNDPLKKMGMTDMFSDRADFSGIAEGLYVSKVLQKAFIEVNEEGSEAAAATAMVVMMKCLVMEVPRRKFVVDHPFMFALVNKCTSTVLFFGRLLSL